MNPLKLKIFQFLEKKEKNNVVFLFFLMIISSVLELLSLGLIIPLATTFVDSSQVYDNFYVNKIISKFNIPQEDLIFYFLFIFFLVYLIKILFLIFATWYEQKFLNSFKFGLSNKFFLNYIRQDYSFFLQKNSSELLRNILSEVEHLMTYYLSLFLFSLESLILLTTFIFLLIISPITTIIAFATFFLFFLLYLHILKDKLKKWGHLRQSLEQKRIQYLQEGFGAVKDIKMMGKENFFFLNFQTESTNLADVSLKFSIVSKLPRFISELIAILVIIFIFIFLSFLSLNFIEIFPILALYLAAAFRLIPSSNRIIHSIQMMKFCYPAIQVLSNADNSLIKITKNQNEKELNLKFNKEIEINIKKFNYENNLNFVIENIAIKIHKGQKIGVIGPSGSGKSTLVDIITGLLKPSNGDVKVDGVSIFSSKNNWQRLIAYIPQKIFILDDTLRNNILFGADQKSYDDDYLQNILKKTNLKNLLKRLPNGFDHKLGERGINLSVGEVQRVGIARALLNDPPIIILDEATSSLDVDTEKVILDELNILENKTFISIAHRMNTLKNSDHIFSLKNGKIVDSGSFDKFNK